MPRTRRVPQRTGNKTSIDLTTEQFDRIEELATRAYAGDMDEAVRDAISTGLSALLRQSHYRIHNCLKER